MKLTGCELHGIVGRELPWVQVEQQVWIEIVWPFCVVWVLEVSRRWRENAQLQDGPDCRKLAARNNFPLSNFIDAT